MCNLLFEGLTGSRQERCSEKNLLLIYVPFNYFDSTKKRKEKVDESSRREEKKKNSAGHL